MMSERMNDMFVLRGCRLFNEKFQRESTPGTPRDEGGSFVGKTLINSKAIFEAK